MSRRRTEPREVLYIQQRVESLERRMAVVEASARALPLAEGAGIADPERRRRFSNSRASRPASGSDDGVRGASGPDGAQLLATQLLLAGHSRESVATYLRETLGIEDPDAILDALAPAG